MNPTEQKIKQAFESATPEVLDRVLTQCGQKKISALPKKKTPNFRPVLNMAASVAIIVLLFGVGMLAALLFSPDTNTPPDDLYLAQPGLNDVPVDTDSTDSSDDIGTLPPGVDIISEEQAKKVAETVFEQMLFQRIHYSTQVTYRWEATPYYRVSITGDKIRYLCDVSHDGVITYFEVWSQNVDFTLPDGCITRQNAINAIQPTCDCQHGVTFDDIGLIYSPESVYWQMHSSHENHDIIYLVDAYTGKIINTIWQSEYPFTAEDAQNMAVAEFFSNHSGDDGFTASTLTCDQDDGTYYYLVSVRRDHEFFTCHISMEGFLKYSHYWQTGQMESPFAYVTEQQAIDAALQASGYAPMGDFSDIVTGLETNPEGWQWRIQFLCVDRGGECIVDAYTGKVLSFQWKNGGKNYIGPVEARMIALRSVGMENQIGSVKAIVKLYEDPTPFYLVSFTWDGTEYLIQVDALMGAVTDTKTVEPAISAVEAERIALEDAGLWEEYKDRPEDVHSKYFAYQPEPFYYVCFQVDIGEYGCTYGYLIHAQTGELMLVYYQEPGKAEYLLSLETAIMKCEELAGVTATEIRYAKVVRDSESPYYHITMIADELILEFEVDILSHQINQLS